MEYRKLISFGKNSFVVSLPKPWIVQNKLKKGDLIYIDEGPASLVLQPRPSDDQVEQKETTINVDGKLLKQIRREIIGAYIKNSKTIILSGNEIKDKAKELQPIIQSLVALEVMEQTSKKIVAKDFLSVDSVSTDTIVRKMDVIVRSMMEDCEKTFDEDVYDSIIHRDSDVNKLAFLMFRLVRYGLDNPTFMVKKFNLTANNLSNLWLLSSDLESVADEIKRVARYMSEIKLSSKEKSAFKVILKNVKDSYLKIMKSYYTTDIGLVHEVVNQREDLIKSVENFYLANKQAEWIGFLTDRTRSAIGHISHIGRILYQG
jgi:phosphate uptake regulator